MGERVPCKLRLSAYPKKGGGKKFFISYRIARCFGQIMDLNGFLLFFVAWHEI